tara:strand:+ start:215 stop:895 length:681 start_codon:yes stop_codon:yes gene_type:complete
MSLTIKSSGDFETLDKGRYAAICYQIVDMGTTNQEYEGKISKKKQVRITFETTSEMMADGRPFSVSQTYTASLSTMASLRKHLESWRNKNFTEEEEAGFDISNLLGCSADVEVGHTSGGNPKIIGLRFPEGGVQKVATKNEQILFDLDVYNDEFRGKSSDVTKAMCDVFDGFPEWLQKDIEDSFEHKAALDEGNASGVTQTEAVLEDSNESLADLASDDDEDKLPF